MSLRRLLAVALRMLLLLVLAKSQIAAAVEWSDVLVAEGEPYQMIRPVIDGIHRASAVMSVAFSPDGRTLASASDDKTVRLWDVASGRERARLEGHGNSVTSVAFSPDGRTLASASNDNTVRLWDVASGRERARLEGHGNWVMSVAFSPDGRTLASASNDNTVRLWDVASGRKEVVGGPTEAAIFVLGNRGTWAGCVAATSRCYRSDDGTLLVVVDESGRTASLPPPGRAQPVSAEIAHPSKRSASGSTSAEMAIDPPHVLPLTVTIRNLGQQRAYFVRVVPAPGEQSDNWVLEPGISLPVLEPGSLATLEARIHLVANPANPSPVEATVVLAVAQAYGEPTLLSEPIRVHGRPPLLQVKEARLLRDRDQQVIAVTVENTGSPIGAMVFRLSVPWLERQSAEVTQERIHPQTPVTLSFGLDPDAKLPSDPKVTLRGLTVIGLKDNGLPIHDWEFKDLPIAPPALQWGLIAGALALLIALGAGVLYQKTYRNPAVLQFTANPSLLRDIELSDLANATQALSRVSRLEPVLNAARVDRSWLDAALSFDRAPDAGARMDVLAARTGLELELSSEPGSGNFTLPTEFSLNLQRLRLRSPGGAEAMRDVFNEVARAREVTLVIGATEAQRRELSALARQQPGMLVAPDGRELNRLLLAEDPVDELARVIARYVPVTQVSPYQTGAGVQRQGLFFGRADLIAQVMGRDPANYLIVGGRQVGKSSLLKEVQRRYANHPQTECFYLVLSGDRGIGPMAAALGLPTTSSLGDLIDEFRHRDRRHTLFIVDEADAFIEADSKRGYETLQALRALSEEGRAHFMLAGFWSLYRQAALDYQSPLKNFGTVLTLGALEADACRALATEPMARLGVQWDEGLVDRLIKQTGQRANLISITCDEVLYELSSSERIIAARHLDAVLAGNRIRDALLGWSDLGISQEESRLDRIVVYGSIEQEEFSLASLLTLLEQAGLQAEPESIKSSVARLELAFVLGRRDHQYAYQVPLQRELIRADDTQLLLHSEIALQRRG